MRILASMALMLAAGIASAGQAVVSRDTSLMAEPYADAEAVASLKAGSKVGIVERSGGWYRIEQGAVRGWLRMASVRLEEQSASSGGGLGQSLRFARSGRSGARNSQATTGIRGLDKKSLAGAQPNYAALDELGGYAVSADAAAKFARKNKLKAQP